MRLISAARPMRPALDLDDPMSNLPADAPTLSLRASQLTPRALSWLWSGRLALGKLAILDADPGMGKTLLTLDLCARVSTGRDLPECASTLGPANALVLNAEDGEEDTTLPRLKALGADLERVFIVPCEDQRTRKPLRLPTQVDDLGADLERTGARLVIIDPIMAFLSASVQISNDQSVREALFPLARLADHHQCAILLVRHLNKKGGGHALYRGGGSIGFLGACRSAWLLARDLYVPDRRVLAQLKNNLAAPQPSLSFSLSEPGTLAPTLHWHGACNSTADQLLAGALRGSALLRPRQRARDFLLANLEDGPRTSRDLWPLAQAQGLTNATLHRARTELDIRTRYVCVDGKMLSYWLLPGQKLPADVADEPNPNDLEPWLAPLRERYASGNPLDDLDTPE
jgi:hypothetical protein